MSHKTAQEIDSALARLAKGETVTVSSISAKNFLDNDTSVTLANGDVRFLRIRSLGMGDNQVSIADEKGAKKTMLLAS